MVLPLPRVLALWQGLCVTKDDHYLQTHKNIKTNSEPLNRMSHVTCDYLNPNFPISQAIGADQHFWLGRDKQRNPLFCLVAFSVPSNTARYCLLSPLI